MIIPVAAVEMNPEEENKEERNDQQLNPLHQQLKEIAQELNRLHQQQMIQQRMQRMPDTEEQRLERQLAQERINNVRGRYEQVQKVLHDEWRLAENERERERQERMREGGRKFRAITEREANKVMREMALEKQEEQREERRERRLAAEGLEEKQEGADLVQMVPQSAVKRNPKAMNE